MDENLGLVSKYFFVHVYSKLLDSLFFFFKSGHLGLQKHGLKIQEDGSLRSKIGDPSFSWSSVLTLHNICSRLSGKPKDRGTGIITSFSGTVYPQSYVP